MRSPAVLAGSLLLGALLATPRSSRASPPPADAPLDPKTAEARRHFKSGTKLYQEENYAGALAEFEAAYENKPGPGSLQNVALCQKALVRYAEAADTLRLLLERHGAELSDEERTAARTAMEELEAHVGSFTVSVRPAHAQVSLDGRVLDASALGAPIRTNAGEHALVAVAPGYTRVTQSVRVVAGARPVPVELVLAPVMGFLEVTATDPAAVVAIDGRPVSMGGFTGPLSPDEEHLVQVYRAGYEPFETRVTLRVGETRRIAGTLGPRTGGTTSAAGEPGAVPASPNAKPKLGWYSIAGLNVFGMGPAPLRFDTEGDATSGGALSLNLRLGRGVKKTLGVEVLVDAGQLNVEDACDTATSEGDVAGDCDSADRVSRNYQLGWFRLGPVVRLTTAGEHVRLGGGFGAGLVWHELRVAAHAADENRQGGEAAGWDAFALLEVGVAYHFGHLSIGLDLVGQVDGASSLEGRFDGANRRPFDRSGNALPLLGIGLRAGYSQWTLEKKTP
jgi:hypothetical protein